MKVGDLVQTNERAGEFFTTVGIIIEVGVYTGNRDIKVLWEDGRVLTYKSKYVKVANESR